MEALIFVFCFFDLMFELINIKYFTFLDANNANLKLTLLIKYNLDVFS